MLSALKLYSKGVAAHNKPLNQNRLSVVPYEVMPLTDGEIDNIITDVEASGTNAYGKEYTVKIKTSACINCDWLPFGDRAVTAPDVRRGERISIYKFGDSNQYFWVEDGLDRHLRRLETIIYRISAEPSDDDTKLDESNCYYFTISSHEKLIELRTSTANGEPNAWVLQLNLADSIFTITDQNGQYVQINSREQLIHLENATKSFIEISKSNIKGYAQDSIFLEARNLIQASCERFLLQAKKSAKFDTPKSEFTGDVDIAGDITAKTGTIGGVRFENGAVSCKTVTAEISVTAPNIP